MSNKIWRWIIGLFIFVLVVLFEVRVSIHKPFWVDEAYGLIGTCSDSALHMLKNGAAGQCSPHPLYYWLHKLLFKIAFVQLDPLISFRMLSIFSAAILTAVSFVFFESTVGLVLATVSVGAFLSEPIFHQFAAESRPYMPWLGFFFLFMLALLKMMRAKAPPSWISIGILGILSISLSLISAAGSIQAATGLFALVLFHQFPLKNRNLVLFGTAVFSLGIGAYYAGLNTCLPMGGEFDLLETKDPRLLFGVLRLLFPKGWMNVPLLILSAIGLGFSVLSLYNRAVGKLQKTWRDDWSILVLSQLLATVVIGTLVAWKGYYFIQRIFIFLIVLKVLLIVIGGSALMSRVQGKWLRITLYSILIGAFLFQLEFMTQNSYWKADNLWDDQATQEVCSNFSSSNVRSYLGLDFFPYETAANHLARTIRLRDQCIRNGFSTIKADKEHLDLLLQTDAKIPFVWTKSTAKLRPLLVCGREVIF